MIGALRHTGNESNLEKLLIGREWGSVAPDGSLDTSRWNAFLDRMHREGVLQQRHWDYVQAEWDLHEELKPLAQAAHRAVYGGYFAEVPASPVHTPWGDYRGGYVPATTDPRLVDDKVLQDDVQSLLGGDAGSFMFPSPARGFTKARNAQYAKALALDLTLAGAQADAVIKFATLSEPVRDVLRLIRDRRFAAKLRSYDPNAMSDLLMPWLRRSARQVTSIPTGGVGGKGVDGVLSVIRRRAVMAQMFGNLVNTPLHLTGVFPASLRAGKANMLEATFRYMRNPKALAENVSLSSRFMADRATNHMHEMADAVKAIVEQRSLLGRIEDWGLKHTFFLQHAVWNVVDQITWTAAYNRAVQTGEADPVAFADSVVRTTIGSHHAVDVSRFEAGPAWAKALTTFSGFYINQGNLLASEFARAVASRNVGRGLEVYLLGFMATAVVGKLMTSAVAGRLGDENHDGEIWDDLLKLFVGSQVEYGGGMVPVIGPAVKALTSRALGDATDNSITLSPIAPVAEGALGTPIDVANLAQGKGSSSRTVRDAGQLVTLLTGIPATLVTRPASYAVGVGTGEIRPTSSADAIRGFVTGAASPESKGH